MRKKISTILSITVAFFSFVVGIVVLQSILSPQHLKIFSENLQHFSRKKIMGGLLLSLLNYMIMIGYDYIALRLYKINLPFKKVALTSFIADSINANVGLSAIVGSMIRVKRYSSFGCSIPQIVKVIAAITTAYWFGFGIVFLFAFLIDRESSLISLGMIRIVVGGIILLCMVIGVIWWIGKKYNASERKRIYKLAISLGIVGICDWIAATSAFIILSPSHISPFRLGIAYLIAHCIGNISQTPGGIAVFESAFLLAAQAEKEVGVIGASLLMFRIIYLLIPFIIALFLLTYDELQSLRKRKNVTEEKDKNITKSQLPLPHLVSVIIPAYNEESTIEKCISSVKNQTYKGEYEIIVVDNASTDRTAEIAKGNGCKVVYEPKKGYYNALQAGFSEARGEIIACTDADSIVPRVWLERFVNVLSNPQNGACSGVFGFHDGPIWLRVLGNIFGLLNWHLAGANMAVRKEVFLKVGGFSPSVTMGTDVELGLRISKISKLVIDRKNRVLTSSRRFQCAFFRTLIRYYLNDLFLLLFKKPLFHGFKDYREEHIMRLSRRKAVYTTSIFLIATILGLGYSLQRPKSILMGYVFSHVKKQQNNIKIVALTFDDGPGVTTDTILDILKRYGIKATFFVIGKNAIEYPEKLQRIVEEGHEIGNHSFSHSPILEFENRKKIGKEISLTNEIIKRLTGKTPVTFRPPHGWRSPWMLKEIREQKLIPVTWDVDSEDWMGLSSKSIISVVIKKVKPGSIILMHDRRGTGKDKIRKNLIEALPFIIENLRIKGYYFVTVSEMLEYSPENAQITAYSNKNR